MATLTIRQATELLSHEDYLVWLNKQPDAGLATDFVAAWAAEALRTIPEGALSEDIRQEVALLTDHEIVVTPNAECEAFRITLGARRGDLGRWWGTYHAVAHLTGDGWASYLLPRA